MDSLLEKITLYDILGYMVPGIFFVILLLIPMEQQTIEEKMELAEKMRSLFTVAALVFVYICGIALSEIARWIWMLWDFIGKKVLKQSYKISGAVDEEKIILALKKSKLVKEENIRLNAEIRKKYYRLMDAVVQTDGEYRRIHNYKSAVVLYKNLVCATLSALLIGGIFFHHLYPSYVRACVGVMVIFCVRLVRFEKKVKEYTEAFFVEKYLGRDNEAAG